MNFQGRSSSARNFRNTFPALFLLAVSIFLFYPKASFAYADDPAIAVGKCWTANGPEGGVFAVAGDKAAVFAAGYDGAVSAFDTERGMLFWSVELGGKAVSNISITAERIYVATRTEDADFAVLRSISRETGVTIWRVQIPAASRIYLGNDGPDVIFLTDKLTLGRHLAADGELLWQRSFPGAELGTEPRFADGKTFFGTSAKRVVVVDLRTGAEDINFETSFVPTFVSGSPDKAIIWGGERGNIVKMTNDAEDTSWRFTAGARVVDAETVGKLLIAASHDNFVYGISAYNGDVVWKRRMPGRVQSFTVMDKEIAVVTVVGESTAHLIDLSNGRIHDRFLLDGANVMPISPVKAGPRDIVVATNTAVARYAIGGCSAGTDEKTAG